MSLTSMKRFGRWTVAALVGATLAIGSTASAKTLRWAGQNDLLTFDPHGQNHTTTHAFLQHVYEALVRYDKNFQVEPALATSWRQLSPTQWRFNLRRNVKFHDGAPFTADDVVFSYERCAAPPSNLAIYVQGIKEVKKVDDFTVDLILDGPNPVLLRQITDARILNKAWAVKHKTERAQNYAAKEESYAARNANGTGPFMLKSWEPDVRTVMVENPNWWDKKSGNVTEVVFTPIKSDPTRMAALLSGQVDLVTDPAPQDLARLRQDPNIKIAEGTENRTIFLGMDQARDELLYGQKGKNPFKDVRVRKALYQAIDIEAIRRATMRGLSIPAGTMIAPMVHGWSAEADKRHPFDVEASKKLLAEAGYPNGIEFTLDCPNNRYVNDEEVCQAIVAMWAKAGVKAKLNAMPFATYIAKITKRDTSVYMLGWGVATFDALFSLQSLIRTPPKDGKGGDGTYNLGTYSNPKMDALIDAIKIETYARKRDVLIRDALKLHHDEVGHLPLHHQVRPWATRKNVTVMQRADDRPINYWTQVD
jgi:peptide/nickel transport system substrate-binding protein